MATRQEFIERALRQIYGDLPNDDASITGNLVNSWLNDAIGIAAKANYKDNIQIDGIGYVNNSFYCTFKNIAISSDGNFVWKSSLPQIPLGIGRNEGISTLQLVDSSGNITRPFIPISEAQKGYFQDMRPIPNKILYYPEGEFAYMLSTLLLNEYTVNVTMISGGDGTDLNSTLNVPSDYWPVMVEYIKQQLNFERNQPLDVQNDGVDAIRTT